MYRDEVVCSRHRLPPFYRYAISVLWLLPIILLITAIAIGRGFSLAFFNPMFLLLCGLMALPAYYIWQEGVDVLESGIVRRMYLTRYYPYDDLHSWCYLCPARVLIIWDQGQQRVLSYHAAHLTDLPVLIQALDAHVQRQELTKS